MAPGSPGGALLLLWYITGTPALGGLLRSLRLITKVTEMTKVTKVTEMTKVTKVTEMTKVGMIMMMALGKSDDEKNTRVFMT